MTQNNPENRFNPEAGSPESSRDELINTLLNAGNFWDRQKAAYALATYSDEDSTQALIEAMCDSMGPVRFGVMSVLMNREGEGVKEALEDARRNDSDPWVRDKAEEGLKRFEN